MSEFINHLTRPISTHIFKTLIIYVNKMSVTGVTEILNICRMNKIYPPKIFITIFWILTGIKFTRYFSLVHLFLWYVRFVKSRTETVRTKYTGVVNILNINKLYPILLSLTVSHLCKVDNPNLNFKIFSCQFVQQIISFIHLR